MITRGHCGPFLGEAIFSMSEKTRLLRSLCSLAMTLFMCGFILTGCGSSVNIPSVEESEKKIAETIPQLDSIDHLIVAQTQSLPKGFDIISHTRMSAINTLLDGITNAQRNDIHFDFLSTRPLWKEEKSTFGITYTNYVDVDSGRLDVDLKKFQFTGLLNNIVLADVEIEGTGSIRVSGKYTGITASAAPLVHFYLNEQLQFSISTADSDYIRLTPLPRTVMLKTKVTINLLGWSIPYYREIPLQSDDLIKPVLIPSALRSEIVFPLPAAQYGEQRLEYVKRLLDFTRSTVGANNNILEYKSNISFIKP